MTRYVHRKTLLNKSLVEWTDRNCNHYVGCAHNCQYPCYASIFSRRSCRRQWTDVLVVENALELAVKEIRHVKPGERIMMSSMTDPYQPIETTERLTRSLIPVLATHCGGKPPTLIIITKSDLVNRDLELISQFPNIKLCMSVTAEGPIDRWEPNAPSNYARIKVLEKAHDMGISTIASIEPWIVGVTKPLQLVRLIYPYVDEVFIGSHNYKYSRHSEANRKRLRTYRVVLPKVVRFLNNHMVKVVVKKELRRLVE